MTDIGSVILTVLTLYILAVMVLFLRVRSKLQTKYRIGVAIYALVLFFIVMIVANIKLKIV